MRLHRFTVEGFPDAGFPIDMLRFDTCWPRSQEDAEKIATQLTARGTEIEAGRVRVTLSGMQEPTLARWKSFGWSVSTDR